MTSGVGVRSLGSGVGVTSFGTPVFFGGGASVASASATAEAPEDSIVEYGNAN